MIKLDVRHNPETRRFEAFVDGELCRAEYRAEIARCAPAAFFTASTPGMTRNRSKYHWRLPETFAGWWYLRNPHTLASVNRFWLCSSVARVKSTFEPRSNS